mgnify:CR=1 FL=1
MQAKTMFCPKCGAGDQSVESYCKRCGEWLPDLKRPLGMLSMRSPEEKIRRMRILEAISAGLSLTAAGIIIAVISDPRNSGMLFLAALCSILVIVYQAINFYLGYNVESRRNRGIGADVPELSGRDPHHELNAPPAGSFTPNSSVIDETTRRLDRIERRPGEIDR